MPYHHFPRWGSLVCLWRVGMIVFRLNKLQRINCAFLGWPALGVAVIAIIATINAIGLGVPSLRNRWYKQRSLSILSASDSDGKRVQEDRAT